jgi:DNA primase
MEQVSIHAAAIKAIEWFSLDSEAMAATSDKEDAGETDAPPTPRPAAKRPVTPVAATTEKSVPNTPLKFRLDKLEREHPYLMQERGLSLETIVDFGVGFCSKGMMADRIAIPIHNAKGDVVAYAGRFPGEPPEGTPKYKLPQGFRKSQELFNIDRAMRESGPLFIVEGFFDVMKLHQHGCKKVVALMGSTMSATQEELIRQHTDSRSQVIIMLDENDAGRAGREDIACRLSRFCFVKVYEFPHLDMEPEHLSAEEVRLVMEGLR